MLCADFNHNFWDVSRALGRVNTKDRLPVNFRNLVPSAIEEMLVQFRIVRVQGPPSGEETNRQNCIVTNGIHQHGTTLKYPLPFEFTRTRIYDSTGKKKLRVQDTKHLSQKHVLQRDGSLSNGRKYELQYKGKSKTKETFAISLSKSLECRRPFNMGIRLPSFFTTEERMAVIPFFFAQGVKPTEIIRRMQAQWGVTPLYREARSIECLKHGRTSLCDDERSGSPWTSTP
ncbi:hypothetical protein TNCV_3540571 [Trichonephila clavipes]|nr:hypothetical protein TNCV_3540571 [Trichonephila clavipes]